jgi:hypothetical protein
VGTEIGENLIVKEGCLDPNITECAEKIKYVTAKLGRTGRIEYQVNVSGSFDASMNIDQNQAEGGGLWGETLAIYSPDNSSITAGIQGWDSETSLSFYVRLICFSSNPNDSGLTRNIGSDEISNLNYIKGYSSNDIRISVQDGKGTCYINNTPYVPNVSNDPTEIILDNPHRLYNRLSVSGINDRDRLYSIKVRGLSPSTCTTDCANDNSGIAGITISAKNGPQISINGGFMKLPITSGVAPLSSDCEQAQHDGRTLVDNVSGKLFICTQSGWVENN